MKTLLVCYSRTGHTRRVAERLAALLEADLEVLKDLEDRSGAIGYMKAGRDALFKRPANLAPFQKDPAAYDLVVLGSPIWAFTLCPGIRTYLEKKADSMARAAFFCTHGGGGAAQAPTECERLLGKPLAAPCLALHDRAVAREECEPAIAAFAKDLAR